MNPENKTPQVTAYIAVIVYESTSDAPSYQPLYQESFVLIKASSQEDAQQKALQYAQQQQTTYKNEQQETISWILKHIIDVNPLLTENVTFENSTELYSRYFRDYKAYTAFEPFLSKVFNNEEIP